MIILGLHFGHDSSISITKNGKPIICIEIERLHRLNMQSVTLKIFYLF